MHKIQTVLGEIDSYELGLIAPHEHFIIDTSFEGVYPKTNQEKELYESDVSIENIGILRRNPFLVKDNMILDNTQATVKELTYFKNAGGKTIVDLTSIGLGRNFEKIRKISEIIGINVITGCGLYTAGTIPLPYSEMTAEQIAAWMIDEIYNGEKSTGIKPGVIGEIGTSRTIDTSEKNSLIASAIANSETHLPIYLHTYPWSRASLEAIDILVHNGVRPEQICVCHLDVSFNHDYLCRILDKGVYAMFDNFGKEYYFAKQDAAFAEGPFETDIDRIRMTQKLIKDNHTERLMFATDVCLKSLLRSYGGWGYDHIFTNIIPMMQNEGISENDIQTIISKNPTNFICSR